ncbi:MAG: ribonuclease HI [Candidatus Paceibacterota bacterium]
MTIIFTDGASRGNPGPGGWGAIIIDEAKGTVVELSGREEHTTNNRMELVAAIQALANIPEGSNGKLYTDSSYLINGITKWVKGWKKIDWVTRAKAEVLNRDLWEKLDELADERNIKWEYVGGHVGIPGNERCDVIATSFADKKSFDLYNGPLSSYLVSDILKITHSAVKSAEKMETKSRSKAKAYSYISSIKGDIKIYHSWPECEKRVKGVRGARYKKALNAEDEEKIIQEFRAI